MVLMANILKKNEHFELAKVTISLVGTKLLKKLQIFFKIIMSFLLYLFLYLLPFWIYVYVTCKI